MRPLVSDRCLESRNNLQLKSEHVACVGRLEVFTGLPTSNGVVNVSTVEAAVLLLESLGGVLRPTEGSQGTFALKWTWTSPKRGNQTKHKVHKAFEAQTVPNVSTVKQNASIPQAFQDQISGFHITPDKLFEEFEAKQFHVSWQFLAGLFDAAGLFRLNRGQISLEIVHRNSNLLESARDFLLCTLPPDSTPEKIDHVVIRDFHRRSRLLIRCNVLSRVILQKLLPALRVRRRAVELVLHSGRNSRINIHEMRQIASAQGTHLESSLEGKLRLIPKAQSFKRHLEFAARQDDAENIRLLLELKTFDLNLLKLLEQDLLKCKTCKTCTTPTKLRAKLKFFPKHLDNDFARQSPATKSRPESESKTDEN